jgi:hypothetical protein
MKLDDLKSGWKTEVEQQCEQTNLTDVVRSLEKETNKLDKSVKRRDRLEISIALLLIPAWIWKLFYAASLIQSVGLWIAILACLLIPYKMLKAKQVEGPKDDSLLGFLAVEKIKLEKQKKLLESIVVWYIAPLMLAIVLITAGATVNNSGFPQMNQNMGIYYFSCALLSVGVYFLNKRAVKKQFTPLLDKVNLRIKELTELNNESDN